MAQGVPGVAKHVMVLLLLTFAPVLGSLAVPVSG